jgi:hypothetical protein
LQKTLSNGLWLTSRTVAAICFTLAVLALVDGALPQFQMILTGGHVYVPVVVVKLAILFLFSSAAIFSRVVRPGYGFTRIWLLAFLYLAVDALFLVVDVHLPLADIVVAYNNYYAYLLIAPMAGFLGEKLSDRWAILFLSIIFIICWVVGTAQFTTQHPLLYTESLEGNFLALSWSGDGIGIRAFSLFSSGLAYGTACSLVGAVGVGMFLKSSQKFLAAALFLTAAFGCYTTFTRNCYIEFSFACCAVVCLASQRLSRLVRYFPILFLIGSMVIAFRGIVADTSDSAVASNVSLLIRAESWQYFLTLYAAAPVAEKIFGLGIIQDSTAALLAVDNVFLAILLNVGLVGLILLFWLHWKMWIRLYTRALTQPSAFTWGVAGFWSTFLAVYFYNIALAPFALVYIMAFIVKPRNAARKQLPGLRLLDKPQRKPDQLGLADGIPKTT